MANDVQEGWIHKFCTRIGNEMFCEVDRDFAKDVSNLVSLNEAVTCFDKALATILDRGNAKQGELRQAKQDKTQQKATENLFGLIHARYIITERGCKKMLHKYIQGQFGRCPRVMCGDANVLPIGLSDELGVSTVKVFCPSCNDIYAPKLLKHCYIDGAYFGTSFPQMLFMMFPECRPLPNTERYVPRLFGFKIHPSAHKYPRTSLQNGRTPKPVATKPAKSTNGIITSPRITYT